ncbi:DNA polymerase I [Monoraphidium neglectum]|uniref:DNA-directed DNA polymerase n=1 Tax=Monoraphidium neglectum TaxID=145388 RepID=A0A0D2LVB8_9CHLO|nr:DNA polymerase I [Monoraphidium neglectum]KIY95524.1 DNA polymerase I [Monoraphidium neglectum]|eukprot:XP_013894544.1 DNA polymerase I [Monoraphidium neglectum]
MQTATATGRLSMEEPSLQTIPKPAAFQRLASLGTQAAPGAGGGGGGAPGQVTEVCNIRAAFVVAPGRVMVSADYAQVEFRLMAHFSGDPALLACFAAGRDPFIQLASNWLKMAPAEVTPEHRNQAKRLAYGVLYGMGPHTLAPLLGITGDAAEQLRRSFLDSMPVLRDWLEGVRKGLTAANIDVQMLSGRKRYFFKLQDPNLRPGLRGHIERAGVNSICQGSAADVVKGVMIQLAQELPRELGPGAAHMVLQIHDELVFEVEAPLLQPAARAIRRIMEGAAREWGLRVALPVNVKVGPSWGELRPYDIEAGAVIASQGAGGDDEDDDDVDPLMAVGGGGGDTLDMDVADEDS